ncbi:DEAD/DEAH box helicase [Photobacterium kasasachensis]|uniref:DEAD/DEAH box helicase n=1 Tax=Photobacterium kasasachensis TaxID=2910240 RepID=UPI003D1441FF
MSSLQSYIEYFRRCYRADSSDLSIANITRIRKDRKLYIKDEDLLLTGTLPRLPIAGIEAEVLLQQADSFRRERRLIYGCFMIKGQLEVKTGFSNQRSIAAPLLYLPATLSHDEDEHLCASIDTSDIRVNLDVLRLLVKPHLETTVVDSFPVPVFPITHEQIALITSWLRENTEIKDLDELARWPQLVDGEDFFRRKTTKSATIACISMLILADRSRGVRGVLHELNQLIAQPHFARPLTGIFEGVAAPAGQPSTAVDLLSYKLSNAQIQTLENAASQPLSVISGPPGTGKSFTIAAIAIDRMLNGESVLVVTKTEQAIDVIGKKLRHDFGLESGFVHANALSFVKTMRQYLDSILFQGVECKDSSQAMKKRVKRARKEVEKHQAAFERSLWAARYAGGENSGSWLQKGMANIYHSLKDEQVLWQSHQALAKHRQAFHQIAMDYVNVYRNEKLSGLLDSRRQVLQDFNRALKSMNSKTQAERFAKLDVNTVLEAFPIWLVTADELSQSLPLIESMFDLVIFDESTQCDIASALPALQRAKRAVVVGDAKQLRHVSFLSKTKQAELWRQSGFADSAPVKYSYRDQSLLDIVSDSLDSQACVAFLNEQYRSKSTLIAFSNAQFYNGRLNVMQSRPSVSAQPALYFRRVDGKRTATGRNTVEKNAAIEHLSQHFDRYRHASIKPTIGVISPYRDQAEFIEKAVSKQFSLDELYAFDVRIATPYGFQGEERDVMILSMAIDAQSTRAAAYLNQEAAFNVAITRAKEKQIVIHSLAPDDLSPNNLFRRYLDFDHQEEVAKSEHAKACTFTGVLKARLEELGMSVWVGFEIAGQDVDIVCEYGGKILGIDLIGYRGEFETSFDLDTYQMLSRAGLEVLPVSYAMWMKDSEQVVEAIRQRVG